MNPLTPWMGFTTLVDGLADLHLRSQRAAARSVDNILTLRNWLIGAWIIAFEQAGSDRATYGEGLINALATRFAARGLRGLGRSNLRNYRQIALIWPRLGICQTPSGEFELAPQNLIPLLPPESQLLAWLKQEQEVLARHTREHTP